MVGAFSSRTLSSKLVFTLHLALQITVMIPMTPALHVLSQHPAVYLFSTVVCVISSHNYPVYIFPKSQSNDEALKTLSL